MKLFIVCLFDWLDARILRHRFYWICKKIALSSWWPDDDKAYGWVKPDEDE